MPEDTRAQRNPPGPVGRNVIDSIEQLRGARRMSYDALSARLDEAGHPINPASLSRLGRGERRVGADDLIGFSVALGVNPSALMFPRDIGRNDPVELTGKVTRPAWVAWEWADGRTPLPAGPVEGDQFAIPDGGLADFVTHARPRFSRRNHPSVQALGVLETRLLMFLNGRESAARVRSGLKRLVLEVDELLGGDAPGEG